MGPFSGSVPENLIKRMVPVKLFPVFPGNSRGGTVRGFRRCRFHAVMQQGAGNMFIKAMVEELLVNIVLNVYEP